MSRAQLTSTVEQNTGGAVAPVVGGKNKSVNGLMDIWQRGTSFTANGYMADHWYGLFAGTTTVSQDTDVPVGVGARYSMKFLTAASSSYANYAQYYEAGDVIGMRGQTVVISWYMKRNSTFSGDFGVTNIYYNNTTDASASQTTAVSLGGYGASGRTPSTSWVRYYLYFTVPSDAVGLLIQFNNTVAQASGAALWFTGVQLEVAAGTIPTPLSRAGGTLSGELAACQRYYYRSTPGVGFGAYGVGGWNNSSTSVYSIIGFPVTMRVKPTAIDYSSLRLQDPGVGQIGAISSLGFAAEASVNCFYLSIGTTSAAANKIYTLMNDNNTAGYLGFSAEL